MPFLVLPSAGLASSNEALPKEVNSWRQSVFSSLDEFSTNYGEFFEAHFGQLEMDELPSWLEVDLSLLSDGESVAARMVLADGNESTILAKLLKLVAMSDEVGLTQFSRRPDFPDEHFVLGRREGSLTLVLFGTRDVQDPLEDLDVIDYLQHRGAFLTSGEKNSDDIVVLTRGNRKEVDIWYPKMAKEVLHTHTIEGNINPTGYPHYFEGSDREMIMSSRRFQSPIKKYVLSRSEN